MDRCAPNQRVNKASANSRRAGLKPASRGFAKMDMDPVADEAACVDGAAGVDHHGASVGEGMADR